MDRYTLLHKQTTTVLEELRHLAGEDPAPSGAAWQDSAATTAINLRALADTLDAMRSGATHHRGYPLTGPVVFPSVAEILDELDAS